MYKFKIGEEVIVRPDLTTGKVYGFIKALPRMVAHAGESMTVTRCSTAGSAYQLSNGGIYFYHEEMLVPVSELSLGKEANTNILANIYGF